VAVVHKDIGLWSKSGAAIQTELWLWDLIMAHCNLEYVALTISVTGCVEME